MTEQQAVYKTNPLDDFLPDPAQLLAFKTWHGSLLDPRHAAMKLSGETGEVVDDLAKHLYKPGYNLPRATLIEEIGDAWYYWRILGLIRRINTEMARARFTPGQAKIIPACRFAEPTAAQTTDTFRFALSRLSLYAAAAWSESENMPSIPFSKTVPPDWSRFDKHLVEWLFYLLVILELLSLSLDEVTLANAAKLSGPDNHGWNPNEV